MLCVKSFQAFLQEAEVATSAKNIFSLYIMHRICFNCIWSLLKLFPRQNDDHGLTMGFDGLPFLMVYQFFNGQPSNTMIKSLSGKWLTMVDHCQNEWPLPTMVDHGQTRKIFALHVWPWWTMVDHGQVKHSKTWVGIASLKIFISVSISINSIYLN